MLYNTTHRFCLVLCFLAVIIVLLASCKTQDVADMNMGNGTDKQLAEGLPGDPCRTALTAEEQKLYNLIMEYRAAYNLPVIPLSPSLSYVAKLHVRDLYKHPPKGSCNLHSWSDDGPWTSCCYTSNHAKAECMWYKPKELTPYTGMGFEISMYYSLQVTAEMALTTWKTSSGHNQVIINKGKWRDSTWRAIGIGIYLNYAVVWFGKEGDLCGGK
ncbi:MAG: CAP domain-containing protein [Spirochaetales bacterium]|nr:CAP domain-containing protein [Spirochaetales bacterium]